MNSWAPLAPSKAGSSSASSWASVLKPAKHAAQTATSGPLIGRYPESIVLRIVHHLPIPDLPNVARCNRALAKLVRDERIWEKRCKLLGLDVDQGGEPSQIAVEKSAQAPRRQGSLRRSIEEDYGDFSNGDFEDVDFGDFSAGVTTKAKEMSLLDFDEVPLPSRPAANGNNRASGFFAFNPKPMKGTFGPYYLAYKQHHLSLIPLCVHLRSSPSPSSTLALLFPNATTLSAQSDMLLSLLLFLCPRLQPLHDWGFLRQALLAAADRFDSTCLVAFEVADNKGNEDDMRLAAESSWKVWDAGGGSRDQWECGRVWVEKREVFYETGKWDALENIVKTTSPAGEPVRQLDFTPMDAFMSHVLETFRLDAQKATRVFPLGARVVVSFCDRVANDVIGEYVQALLSQTRIVSPELFLQASAAAFVQSWKLVDVTMEVLGDKSLSIQVEDVIYKMFEVNIDEYLDEETESVKRSLDSICRMWDTQRGADASMGEGPTFLNASNPDQVKKNVLAGFRDVLLLPVTIVPRTVTYGVHAIVSGGSHAVNGLSMLNPQKWSGSEVKQQVVFEEKDELPPPPPIGEKVRDEADSSFDRLQLLVSLDTALELIHADRDSLKRCETFANYPGKAGHRVRETIEEIFILLLKAVGDRHIAPGFKVASQQMSSYKPAAETTSVAPLLQFFELVHVGDTIQSMVQVYFDKDLAKYVDKTDFLNAVMREKKRFETVLDDAVAGGLNAGIEVLMNQVEHIIQVKTGPREYYPTEGTPLELGPTEGCREAIACLEMHCNLLRGSTSKEVLEVFYQEVGIRLQAILQRHLKRQIISLEGGFQIIADLNAYHAFITSLKQPRITEDFANLKMLGHVYIVSDGKDLAQIVRDVTRYGGTFRPEDIYEFIQRRSDWKKIEKTVDKAMYSLSVRDDCVVM
ncbi:exocyst complex component Sec10-domain-containing protein [Kockovaella imperatae]|uniref:Exocyst complex component Sec10-domain-containing protein n=1 Tax=Kockovaella imperatae TaxID=4999 RepID=A0A1Y1UTJ8_9TREE|nr:exocyst complex component Sec10-domain-containing protein [Kockovaella imperatae]ORX40515.1 exocyst complex component Sec10-domain-containing protein [Kockovaella imperatae]